MIWNIVAIVMMLVPQLVVFWLLNLLGINFAPISWDLVATLVVANIVSIIVVQWILRQALKA